MFGKIGPGSENISFSGETTASTLRSERRVSSRIVCLLNSTTRSHTTDMVAGNLVR